MLWKFNFQKKKIDLRKLNFHNIICLNSKNYNLEIQFPKVKKNDFRKFNFRNIIKLRIKKRVAETKKTTITTHTSRSRKLCLRQKNALVWRGALLGYMG